MSEETQQAVAEDAANPEPEAQAEATGAQDEGPTLDDVLSEFDSAISGKADSPSEPEVTDKTTVLESQLRDLQTRVEMQQFERDMADTISKVRGDNPVSDKWVRGWINAEAEGNPKLQKAWNNRHNDPGGFSRVVNALGKQFAKELSVMSSTDEAATADREAVAQAVRGSSNPAPDGGKAPDFSRMNDAEARDAMRKMGIEPQF